LLFNSFGASAGELGHFAPGVFNIRDFAMPPPGFYGALYNYFYTTDRLNDRNGNKVHSVTIGPGPGVTLDVDVDVDIYVVAPTLIWASPWTIAGARYGALISPTFATSSLGAALATETGRGVNAEISSFGAGDMYVQPLWLDWALPLGLRARLRFLRADREIRRGYRDFPSHRPSEGRGLRQHRVGLLDAPVSGGDHLVSL